MPATNNIGHLQATIGANTAPLQASLKQTNALLRQADANIAGSFKRASLAMNNAGKAMKNVGRSLSMYVTLPMMAAGAGAFKMYKDFEFAMTQINTLVGVSIDQVHAWKEEVLSIGPEIGKGPK